MDDKLFENKIKKSLLEETDSSLELKDKVWKGIVSNINNTKGGLAMSKNNRKRRSALLGIVSTAAVVALVFFIWTPTGQAAVKKVKDLLVPEKVIVENLEGQDENTKVSLSESDVGYSIYFDHERYSMEKINGIDRIVPNIKAADHLPKIFMEIEQIKDKSPEELLPNIESELNATYPMVERIGKVEQPINSLLITAKSGVNWNDTVTKYYLIDNQEGGTFVVKQQYFQEAAEGHGARFYNMLKEFRLLPAK